MGGSAIHARAHVSLVRVALQQHWRRHWLNAGNWYLTGYWELGVSYWYGRAGNTGIDHLDAVDFRPVLRRQSAAHSEPLEFYLEAGVGPALLSSTQIEGRRFSTAFQFGSHVGIGMRFGPEHRYELAYRLMHYSNADIKKPNHGITFNVLQLGARF
ncbi:MAG: acyloxyacyl hydrolase [Gammaproteobacteria bacterium]